MINTLLIFVKVITHSLPHSLTHSLAHSSGHIRDLLKKESVIQSPSAINKHIILQELNLKVKDFGVDVFNNFEPIYAPLRDKQEIYERLKREAAKCSEILLATDEDREGEAISWHLVEMLKPKVPFKRAVFHEITKDAILQAFQNPREIDMQLVQSQETRRIIDRLTGYTITPIIWRYIAPGLSAGRVQSCGLYLIAQVTINLFSRES
jgi:DNA topoisomerase-1